MKSKIYEFDPVIYPFQILISRDWDVKELIDRFYEICEGDVLAECAEDTFVPNRCTTARSLHLCEKTTKRVFYMILIMQPKIVKYGIITHESFHIANAYLQYLGLSAPKAWDDEAYAYFGGWLASCIWATRNNEPEKMNGVLFK
jgi:hypothetical protein